jgi:hypothetical protein
VEISVRSVQRSGVATANFWFAEGPKRIVKYQFRQNIMFAAGLYWTQPNMDMELVSYTPAGGRSAAPTAEKAASEKAAAEKAPAGSAEAQLERFIQRKGRDKVLAQEPGYTGLQYGEVVYINDGTCPPGRIREVTGTSTSWGGAGSNVRPVQRPSRCISLAD